LSLDDAKAALANEEASTPASAEHIRLLREFLETSARGIIR
jgi:UDP-N-acetylglucosamine acyltransferase